MACRRRSTVLIRSRTVPRATDGRNDQSIWDREQWRATAGSKSESLRNGIRQMCRCLQYWTFVHNTWPIMSKLDCSSATTHSAEAHQRLEVPTKFCLRWTWIEVAQSAHAEDNCPAGRKAYNRRRGFGAVSSRVALFS